MNFLEQWMMDYPPRIAIVRTVLGALLAILLLSIPWLYKKLRKKK